MATSRSRPPAKGLRPAAPDRRPCHRQGRRRRHDPVRPRGPRLVLRDPRRARDPAFVDAADVRGSRDHGHGDRGGGRCDRAACRHAGRRRGRGPGRERGGRRRRVARDDGPLARNVRRGLRRHRPAAVRAARPRPRVLSRGPRSVALHVGDALGGGEPALVPRRTRTGRGVRRARRVGRRGPGRERRPDLPAVSVR